MGRRRDRADDRFAIRGDYPEAQVHRLAASLSDYDPSTRRRIVGAMNTVGLVVLVASVVLVALGFWML